MAARLAAVIIAIGLNSKTRIIRSVTSCKQKKAIVNTSAPKHSRLVPCSDRWPELKSVSRHREWCLFVLGIFAIKFVLLIVDPLPKYYLGDSFSYIYTATSGWIPPDRSYFYGYVIRWLALWTGSLTPLLIVQVCLGGIVAIVAAWICWTIFELPSWASIFLLTCTGYPSQSGFKPKANRSQAWDALQYANSKERSRRYEAQEEFSRFFRDAPGIVLSDIDPPYLNVLLSKPFIAAPIDDLHNYCYSRLWHYGKAEAIRLVQSGLDHATPVYALLLPSKHNDQDVPRLPSIQGYSWRRGEKSSTRAVIMTLTKNASAPTPDSASHQ